MSQEPKVDLGKKHLFECKALEIWICRQDKLTRIKSNRRLSISLQKWVAGSNLEIWEHKCFEKEILLPDRILSTFALIICQLNHFLVLTYRREGFLDVGNLIYKAALCLCALFVFATRCLWSVRDERKKKKSQPFNLSCMLATNNSNAQTPQVDTGVATRSCSLTCALAWCRMYLQTEVPQYLPTVDYCRC